jgi:hypothetical protein
MFEDLLGKIGVNLAKVDRIRLSRGVLGRISIIAIVAMIALAFVAWKLTDQNLLVLMGVEIFLVFCLSFAGILWYANKNPQTALFEGADVIQWKQLEMAIRGVPVTSPGPLTSGQASEVQPKLRNPDG